MNDKIAVIGAGMMGGAIIKSLVKGGYKGKITGLYDCWSLPSLYIMDNKDIIAAKPMNADYVKKEFESTFKKEGDKK